MDLIEADPDFLETLEQGESFQTQACFQCRKCTNGCPLTFAMDLFPDEVVRLVALGQKERVLRCRTIWVCSSCETCTTRCPNEVRIAELMDRLKEFALEEGILCPEPAILGLHQTFIAQIKQRGRIFETTLLPAYFLRGGQWLKEWKAKTLFREMLVGAELLRKGRLPFRTEKVKDLEEIAKCFSLKRR